MSNSEQKDSLYAVIDGEDTYLGDEFEISISMLPDRDFMMKVNATVDHEVGVWLSKQVDTDAFEIKYTIDQILTGRATVCMSRPDYLNYIEIDDIAKENNRELIAEIVLIAINDRPVIHTMEANQ